MDWKAEIEGVISELRNQPENIGAAYTHAFNMAALLLSNVLRRAEAETGWDVWVSEDGAWRKVAWFADMPSPFVIMRMNKDDRPHTPFDTLLEEPGNNFVILNSDEEVIRRYRVQPAGSPAPVDEAPEAAAE